MAELIDFLRRRRGLAAILLVLAQMLTASGAFAEELTFRFTNRVAAPLFVELYSNDRQKIWPKEGRLFILADAAPRKLSVSCDPGEKICYGAWIEGDITRFWGVGHEGKAGCDDCCRYCEAPSINSVYQVVFK